jgi:tetratricopeptide (TPR) repeat protein
MIRFSCPQCHTAFQLKDETAGRKTKCPKCRAAISIPLTIPCDTPPLPPPEAAAVADETGDLSRETAAPNPVDFWDTLPAPVEVTSTPLRGTANGPRRQKRQLAHSGRSGRRSLVYLCMGGVLLIAIGVTAALWTTGFLSRAQGQRTEQANTGEVASSVTGAGSAPVKKTPAPANAPGSGQHDSFQTIYLQGQKLLDDGELDQAVGSFDKAIQLKPDAATAYNARGVAYLRQHRLARALSDFEQAIRLDPKLAKYYANRGLVHRDQEKYDLAIADFSKAIELSPNTPDLYDERAETLVFKNDMKQTPASQSDHATAERLRKGKTPTVSSHVNTGLGLDRKAIQSEFENMRYALAFGASLVAAEGYSTFVASSIDGMTNLKLYEESGVLFRIDLVLAIVADQSVISRNLDALRHLLDVSAPAWSSRQQWLAAAIAKLGLDARDPSKVQQGVEYTVENQLRFVLTTVRKENVVAIVSIMRADDPKQFPLTDVATASSDKSASTVSRTKSVALLPAPTEAAIKSDPRFAETDARIRETNTACAEKVKPLEMKHKRLASQRKSASRSRSRTGLTRAEKLAQEDDAVVKEIQALEKERVQKVRRMFNEFCAATGHEPLYIDDGFGRFGDRDEIAAAEARRKQRQELARVSGTPRLAADNHIKVLLANGTLRQAAYLKEEVFRPGQRDPLDNALGTAFGTRGRGNSPPQLFDELDPKWKAVYYRVTYVSQAGLFLEKDAYVLTYKKENASVIGPAAMPESGALWDVEGFHIPGVPE